MKKYLLGVFVVMCLLLSGCAKNETEDLKTGKITCTQKADLNGATTDNVYTINYKGDYVTLLESVETVVSSDKKTLEAIKKNVEAIYEPLKDFEHYEYKVEINGDTLTSTVKADYEKMDMTKFVELNEAMKSFVKDGKISVENMKLIYASSGITCE